MTAETFGHSAGMVCCKMPLGGKHKVKILWSYHFSKSYFFGGELKWKVKCFFDFQ